MSIAATIREKLMIALRPTRLDVNNESHVHAGHQSSPGTGESHFRVLVMSPEFAGKSRVEAALSLPWRTIDRSQDRGRQSPDC